MTLYRQNGSNYFAASEADMIIMDTLPRGTYTVNFDAMRGFFYLTKSDHDKFDLGTKLYGDVSKRADRIINTFKERPNSTGVILAGEKGSGKTMLTKYLSNELNDQGVITIIVNTAFGGTAFNEFISSIEQPSLVMFDEFEKVYSENEHQDALLTLFDGIYPSKKLFVITCNDKYKLNNYMINRPGRFYYSFIYSGLAEDFIIEYLEDRLNDKKRINETVRYLLAAFQPVNFDMLKAVVEEMNRYNEDVFTVLHYLNISEQYSSVCYDIVEYRIINEELKKTFVSLTDNPVHGGRSFNAFTNSFYFHYNYNYTDKESKETWVDDTSTTFNFRNIVAMDGNTITYRNNDFEIKIRQKVTETFDVSKFLM